MHVLKNGKRHVWIGSIYSKSKFIKKYRSQTHLYTYSNFLWFWLPSEKCKGLYVDVCACAKNASW